MDYDFLVSYRNNMILLIYGYEINEIVEFGCLLSLGNILMVYNDRFLYILDLEIIYNTGDRYNILWIIRWSRLLLRVLVNNRIHIKHNIIKIENKCSNIWVY